MKQCHLLYVHDTKLGYARYGVKLAEALTRAGVKVDDTLDPDATDIKHLAVWVATPSHCHGFFDAQRPVISTMFESMSLPEGFREALHNFRQIIVPSEQNRELFGRYHDNVVKVPLGVDSAEWAYRQRKPAVREFKFLIGGSGDRKGLDLAYKAFRKVFKTWPSDMPRPVLQFKSPRPIEYAGERIEWIGGKISDEDERELYAAAHCYLQPSRGEGFGLQPLQAIAQGLPTILTDAHGHAEFSHLGYGISARAAKSSYFIFGDAGDWWEPSLDELCQYMEWVYHHYDEACERAVQASRSAHTYFNWDVCARNFIDAIGEEHFEAEYSGERIWATPDIKRYLTRVAKFWACEIAGIHHQFHPGVDYWELADVKRILFEAEVLDPSCVTLNLNELPSEFECGLAPEQLKDFGRYSASMSYCHSCGQVLNSGELYQP